MARIPPCGGSDRGDPVGDETGARVAALLRVELRGPQRSLLDPGDEAVAAVLGPRDEAALARGEVAGRPFNVTIPEGAAIPALPDRVLPDPARTGVFVNDWRVEPQERAA